MFLGFLPFCWDKSIVIADLYFISSTSSSLFKETIVTLVFVALMTLHDMFIGLPFSIYKTFVVEARHGFNKTTITTFITDKAISFCLTIVFGFPVIGAIIYCVRNGGEYFYFYVWLFLFVFSLVMMIIAPTIIMPLFNKFTPLEAGKLRTAIEELSNRVSFPLTQVFLVDG